MPVPFGYEDCPALHRAADASSLRGQRRHVLVTGFQLGASVTAAAFGVVAFGVALVSDVYLPKERPERQWYAGRAVAESMRTEEERAGFAGGSEDAVSREHTLWRASHS